MNRLIERIARSVTARPFATIGLLVVVTVVLASGAALRAPLDETDGFIPPDSAIKQVLDEIEESFAQAGNVRLVTVLFRGPSLSPDGLAQMDALGERVVADPQVRAALADDDPIVSPTSLIRAALPQQQTISMGGLSQDVIDAAAFAPPIYAALTEMTGTDTDGTDVAIAAIRLNAADDQQVQEAERLISEFAVESVGPLQASTVSPTVIEDEYQRASREGVAPLMGLALALIAVILILCTRSLADVLLTLAGLVMSVLWVVGAEGWLGPNGLGFLGRPSGISVMIPIILIGLTVDYAIQTVSHYREQRIAGDSLTTAIRTGLRDVSVPLLLAVVTTMVSFLVGLLSPIPAIRDFGVVAALAIAMSLIVTLSLLPAARLIIERRREARGKLTVPRSISTTVPGVRSLAGRLGTSVTRRPVTYIAVTAVVTIGLGFAATDLKAEFSIRDVLPSGGSLIRDLNTLDAAIGGATEMTNLLVKAEATEARTLLDLRDLRSGFEDGERRPLAAAGPIEASYDLILLDWINDSGEPGDKYDAELATLYRQANTGLGTDRALMQELLGRLLVLEPATARLLVNDPVGIDTMLLRFPATALDAESTKRIQEQVEALWFGDDESITAVSQGIVSVAVTDEISSRQTEAIAATIIVALLILLVFFWATMRQPVLAFIAVLPTVIVLVWVLGTMALLGIPYTLVTSIITALTVGIAIDYTIHLVHRYRVEFSRSRLPDLTAVRTLEMTGPALFTSALTTMLGVGVLVLSPTSALRDFGLTVAIAIGYALVVSCLVVPLAMTMWGTFRNMQLQADLKRVWDDIDVLVESH